MNRRKSCPLLLALLVSCGTNLLSADEVSQSTADRRAEPAAEQSTTDRKSAPVEADPREGRRVIVMRAGAELRTPEATVWRAYIGDVYVVSLTNDKWLWIAERGGWLREEDVRYFDTAISELTELVSKEPGTEHHYQLGIAYAAHGEFEKAIEQYTLSLSTRPGDPGILNNRGQAKYACERIESAINDFSEAIRIDRQHFVALNNRALCYIAQENWSAALQDLNAALKIHSRFPEALNNRGIVHAATQDFAAAVQDYTQALEIDPGYVDAYGNRAYALRELGQAQKALADLRAAVKRSPNDYEPLNDLAWMLATDPDESVRDPKEALQLATTACQLTQYENWNTLDTLAVAAAATGDFKNAIQWISKAIDDAPEQQRPALKQRLAAFENNRPVTE